MPLVLFYTRRVRQALKAPGALGAELVFLAAVGSAIGLLVMISQQMAAPYSSHTVIDLSFSALPRYTMLSLARGCAAYVISLVFTLIYGTIAAHNHRAEKLMIPALDVLQAIPVLGFLPGLVLVMIGLFPTREIGLELACVIMIFTAQAWNMTFSFHGSLRGIPTPLREVAAIQRLNGWQIFRLLEVPAAMIGLIWNSMMSMAGGWFFLTVNEAFTLKNRDYRLPGIGSYMNEAINRNDKPAMIAAVIAMIIMIVAVDQLLWRPLVVWSQRFKVEEQATADPSQSWVLNMLQRSRLYLGIGRMLRRRREPAAQPAPQAVETALNSGAAPAAKPAPIEPSLEMKRALALVKWIVLGLLALGAVVGAWQLVRLLIRLPLYDRSSPSGCWLDVFLALLASFARTTAAVLLGAAWALPAGIAIGRSPRWSERLQPIIQVVASFPAPMIFPLVTLALVALHIPFTVGCVALMLLGAQWYILFNVIAGASAIPHDLTEVTEVYRLSRWQCWRKLYIPCVFPYLVTGLVTAAGGAWNATIVSEYVLLPGENPHVAFGLGSAISKATEDGNYPLLAAGVVTMAFSVVLLNRFIWKRMYRLAEDRFSLNV